MTDDIQEALAEYAHTAWSGWMDYLFSLSKDGIDGDVIIPAELVRRWERQMKTKYVDLPEPEKESDRIEARKMLKIVTRNIGV